MRIMVDLNVLLDVAQNRTPVYQDFEEVLARAREGEYEAFLPGRALTTFFYLMAKFADVPTAQSAVDGLLADFGIVGPDKTILSRARSLPMTDFEDCVVEASAEAAGCHHVVTRNVADFAGSPVPDSHRPTSSNSCQLRPPRIQANRFHALKVRWRRSDPCP